MLGRVPALNAIIELGIGADIIVADQEARGNIGIFGEQPLDQRDDRIVRRLHAEQQLVIGIIQFERGAQRLLAKGFQSPQRPHQRDGRRRHGNRQVARPGAALARRHEHRGKIEDKQRKAPDGAYVSDNGHIRPLIKPDVARRRNSASHCRRARRNRASCARRRQNEDRGGAGSIFRLTFARRLGKREPARDLRPAGDFPKPWVEACS